MPIPDPSINAAFIAIADRFANGELTSDQFHEATRQLMLDHGLILPEQEDMDPDEPAR